MAVLFNNNKLQFNSEHTPISQTGWFLSDAWHRIWFAIYRFVPVPYFISETLAYEWSKDWVKQWALHWSAISSCKFHCYSVSNEQKKSITTKKLQSIQSLLNLELSHYHKSGSTCCLKQDNSRDCSILGNTLCSTSQSCAGELAQQHGQRFCSQNIWMYSWATFWSDCKMIGRG